MTADADPTPYAKSDRRAAVRAKLHFEYAAPEDDLETANLIIEQKTTQLEEAVRVGRNLFRRSRIMERRLAEAKAEAKHLKNELERRERQGA